MSSSFEIIYYPAAINDIKSILDYISTDNPSAGISFIEKINTTIGQLSQFPLLGSIPKDTILQSKNYRMLIIDNYIAFYFADENKKVVEIMRVLSSKQNYKTIL
jgi:toxin ParE1/3/4